MKKVLARDRERKRIAQLAREYRGRGYDVFADVPGYRSPDLIEGIRPDLVAKKGDEVIVMEVKTRESMKGSKDRIEYLARYADREPRIRFDLVLTNPRPQSSIGVRMRACQEQLQTLQDGLLSDIEEAMRFDRTDLVLVLAVRLLEGLLVRVAAKKQIEISAADRNLVVLSEKLAGANVVSTAVLEFAHELQGRRNALVHGVADELSKEYAIEIHQKLTSLLREW
jgi:hypothetical protein